jgi:hypothetical protein
MCALTHAGTAKPDPGRRVWGLSGLVTAAALIGATAWFLTPASDNPQNATAQPQSGQPQVAQAQATMTRTVTVPGGPYALTADSGGGPESIGIATNPDAARSITVSSAGGPLTVGP